MLTKVQHLLKQQIEHIYRKPFKRPYSRYIPRYLGHHVCKRKQLNWVEKGRNSVTGAEKEEVALLRGKTAKIA